jgi:hypothetical protein
LQVAHGPPQSTSSSAPFWVPSVQLGAAHTAILHTLLSQSLGKRQLCPGEHLAHAAPPQSTPVSSLFLTLSWQVGAAHVIVPRHTPLSQSEDT